MKKKKIVFLVNSNAFSGLESVCMTIIEYLNKKYEFIYVTQDGPIVDVLKEKNINYFVIKKMSTKEIKRVVKELRPDIIHAHDYTASCISALAKLNIPIISHLHNNSPWIKTHHPFSFLYLYCSRRFDKILTVSDSIEEEYIFSKYINKKIINISNPVSRKYILDKVEKHYEKIYDICNVGRLTSQKNPLKFIRIVNEVKKIIPNIKVVMIGDGELKSECINLINKLGLQNNIELLGFKKNPYEFMSKSKIFCLTSEWEGYGLVAFESLTLGLPCIVSPVGGLVNLVDEECGFLVYKEEDFKNSIIQILNDEIVYNEKSLKARQKANKLENIDLYCEKLEKIYMLKGQISYE